MGWSIRESVWNRRGGPGYSHAMELATERIWITQPYFVPDERFPNTLRAAARRSVDVRIVVAGTSDVGPVVHAPRSHRRVVVRGRADARE